MNEFVQFSLAMWDALIAAMIGLNPVPAIIISLIIGMGQARHEGYLMKAMVAIVPAVLISALWPAVYNSAPIWPDLRQLEVEIQIGVLLIVSYVIIKLLAFIKSTLSGDSRPAKA